MRKPDLHTGDLFAVPQPVQPYAGSLSCRAQIASVMSEALKGYDRFDVAAKMSKLLGRDISKHMLDAYTAESREEHIPPLDTAMAFDMATDGMALLTFYSHMLGASLVVGKEYLNWQLGRLEKEKEDKAREIKRLRKALGGGK